MNYRHGFHAGNHADVLKHVCLLALLDALMRKSTPIFVLDTHAGAGDYDLASLESSRTHEARAGVQRLLASGVARSRQHPAAWVPSPVDGQQSLPDSTDNDRANANSRRPLDAPALARYVEAIVAHRERAGAQHYPGSPALIAATLRAQDRLAVCEVEAVSLAELRRGVGRDPRVAVHARDGYAALKALLPPVEKRGLVLIDPPYEAQLAEFDAVLSAVKEGMERWPQGIFAIWYPIKLARSVQPFLRKLSTMQSDGVLDARLLIRAANSPLALNGSGLVIINPPWQLDRDLAPALHALAKTLGEDGDGSCDLRWLREPR